MGCVNDSWDIPGSFSLDEWRSLSFSDFAPPYVSLCGSAVNLIPYMESCSLPMILFLQPFCLHLVNSETVVTWWSPLCQPGKFDLGLIFTLSVVVGLSAVYTFLLLLCPHVDLFLTFLSFFPAGRRDCDLFGLCEERLSSVWVFLSLPAVYATHAVPGGAWSVGHCWAGKQTRWHTLHHIVC